MVTLLEAVPYLVKQHGIIPDEIRDAAARINCRNRKDR